MQVKVRETKRLGSRHHEKRRGRRMNSRVPVRLEWDDETSKRVTAEAHTRVVNPYGCMVVLKHELNLEHRLALTNLISNTSNAAIIVWKGVPTAGNTVSSSSRRKWISGDLNCEAFAVRETRCDSRRAPHWLTPRADAAAYR